MTVETARKVRRQTRTFFRDIVECSFDVGAIFSDNFAKLREEVLILNFVPFVSGDEWQQ